MINCKIIILSFKKKKKKKSILKATSHRGEENGLLSPYKRQSKVPHLRKGGLSLEGAIKHPSPYGQIKGTLSLFTLREATSPHQGRERPTTPHLMMSNLPSKWDG
jgi:hypothetical protein